MKQKSLWPFLKDVFTQWIDDEPFLLASSLSYYTLFSLAPLLVIAIALDQTSPTFPVVVPACQSKAM